MKSIVMIFLVLCSLLSTGNALQGRESSFQEGNEAYRTGDYKKAYQAYEAASNEIHALEVFYNMGNAAFKMSNLGLAIWNYERARKLDPRNEDVLANLSFAESLVEYRVSDQRNWYHRKFDEGLERVTFDELIMVSSIAYFGFMLALLVNLLMKKRFVMSNLGSICLAVVILTALPAGIKFYETQIQQVGVVTSRKAEARYGPTAADQPAFNLVEGIKVQIVDQWGDWFRIRLLNQESGWIPKKDISVI